MILSNYLNYLQESEEPEKVLVKKQRLSNPFIYLYHGTRAKDEVLKKEGLKLLKAYRYGFEEEKWGNYISFTSKKEYAERFITGIFSKTSVLLCKLNVKYLKFGYNRKGFDEYVYFRDVSPKDIIFPDDPLYEKIEQKYNYLD